jgi:zinc D-Ala-D-Ala carboxypeptidase
MGIPRRQAAAFTGAIALAGTVGVSTVGVGGATAAPAPTASASTPTSAFAAARPPAATGYLRSRLALTVTGGAGLTVVGVLTRASNGDPATRRPVVVYVRTADTGPWRAAATLRTSSRGRVTYRIKNRPLLQITLRFDGDRRFLAAASVTVVPEPSATAMRPGLVRALARARAAAKRVGLALVVNSGYRDFAKQERMYRAAVRRYGSARLARTWVLPPQESTHVRGLAADIGTPATAAWLNRHGAAFGLCRAYGDEPWHFEYRPDWVAAFHGRCPAPVPLPGDPDPLSPAPRVAVLF